MFVVKKGNQYIESSTSHWDRKIRNLRLSLSFTDDLCKARRFKSRKSLTYYINNMGHSGINPLDFEIQEIEIKVSVLNTKKMLDFYTRKQNRERILEHIDPVDIVKSR